MGHDVSSPAAGPVHKPRLAENESSSSHVSIYEISDLLIALNDTMNTAVMGPLASVGYALKDHMDAIGELKKDIMTLQQTLKTDKDTVSEEGMNKVKDIVERMQQLVSGDIKMPDRAQVNKQFLTNWSGLCDTENSSSSSKTTEMSSQMSTIKQNQSVLVETASALIKTDTSSKQQVAQAGR